MTLPECEGQEGGGVSDQSRDRGPYLYSAHPPTLIKSVVHTHWAERRSIGGFVSLPSTLNIVHVYIGLIQYTVQAQFRWLDA